MDVEWTFDPAALAALDDERVEGEARVGRPRDAEPPSGGSESYGRRAVVQATGNCAKSFSIVRTPSCSKASSRS